MNEHDMRLRTKQFALRVVRLVNAMPASVAGRQIGRQLFDCGTSVGANYRAACRARSKAEFIAKLGIVEEEADESAYWMEVIVEGGILKPSLVEPLRREANELLAMVIASRKTAMQNVKSANAERSKIKN